MIILSYWVISAMNQKKKNITEYLKHLPFEKYCQTKALFKKTQTDQDVSI